MISPNYILHMVCTEHYVVDHELSMENYNDINIRRFLDHAIPLMNKND